MREFVRDCVRARVLAVVVRVCLRTYWIIWKTRFVIKMDKQKNALLSTWQIALFRAHANTQLTGSE